MAQIIPAWFVNGSHKLFWRQTNNQDAEFGNGPNHLIEIPAHSDWPSGVLLKYSLYRALESV